MTVRIDDIDVDYRLEGPKDASVVTLIHSLATDLAAWDEVASGLAGRYRVLSYNLRGHGGTSATPPPYTLDLLAGDLAKLLDVLDVGQARVVGLSIGGMIAGTFALTHPRRLDRLVLASTLSELPEGGRAMWDERIAAARQAGMDGLVDATLARWFTPGFLDSHPAIADRVGAMIRSTSLEGYLGCCAAVRELDLTSRLDGVTAPTLVLAGAEDPGATPAAARLIADAIPGAHLRVVEGVSHQMQIQAPQRVLAEIARFLDEEP